MMYIRNFIFDKRTLTLNTVREAEFLSLLHSVIRDRSQVEACRNCVGGARFLLAGRVI